MKSYKLIAIAVVVVLCISSLVMWRMIDKPTVQRDQDITQTRQEGNSLFPTTETKKEPRDQSSFFIPQTVPQEERMRYPKKVTEAIQVSKNDTATRQQLQDGMTILRDEARNYRENGKVNEAMDLETRAMELEASRMKLEARSKELEVKEMKMQARAMERERKVRNR